MNRATMSNRVAVRVELYDGWGAYRGIDTKELMSSEDAHRALCREFSLDPASTWFDVPDSFYERGSARVGSGGVRSAGVCDGYVMRGPKGSEPIGKIIRAKAGEKFRDYDPTDKREFFSLGRH